jgi:hypothetical protein
MGKRSVPLTDVDSLRLFRGISKHHALLIVFVHYSRIAKRQPNSELITTQQAESSEIISICKERNLILGSERARKRDARKVCVCM